MKTGKLFVYGGSAVLLAVTTLSGCQSPELMQKHTYLIAPDQPAQASEAAPATPAAPASTFTPNTNPNDTLPAIQAGTPATTPQFPAFTPSAAPATASFQGVEAAKTYTVKSGDSLWTIAKHHGVSVEDLKTYNNLNDKSKLQIGKTLRLPPGSIASEGEIPVKHTAKKTEKPVAAKKTEKAEKTEKPVAAKKTEKVEKTEKTESVSADKADDNGKSYVVKKGDFWAKIAKAHHVSPAALAEANKKKVSDTLQVGQKLVIPAAEAKTEGKAAKKGQSEATEAAATTEVSADAKTTKNGKGTKTAKGAKTETKETKSEEMLKGMPEETAPKKVDELATELDKKTVKTKDVDVPEDTTIAQFAAKNGVSVEDIKKNNPEINADGKLKKGDLVTIPE